MVQSIVPFVSAYARQVMQNSRLFCFAERDTAPIAPDPQRRNGTAWKSELRAKKVGCYNLADGGGPPSKDPVVRKTRPGLVY